MQVTKYQGKSNTLMQLTDLHLYSIINVIIQKPVVIENYGIFFSFVK